MAEPASPLVRRLVVVGSFGLFALAVVRAQSGCSSDAQAPARVGAQPAAKIESPTKVDAPPAPPPAAIDSPDPSAPPAAEEPDPPRREHADSARGGEPEVGEDVFLGASKSGLVVNKPRPGQEQQTPQQNPAPQQQQNARPGS